LLASGENWSQFGLTDVETEVASIVSTLGTIRNKPSALAERFRAPRIRSQWAEIATRIW
jgi:hypothetical protein